MCSRCLWIPCEARSWAWVGTSAPECPGPGSKTGSGNMENRCSLEPWVWHSDVSLRTAGGLRVHKEVSPVGSQGSCCCESHNHYERRKE